LKKYLEFGRNNENIVYCLLRLYRPDATSEATVADASPTVLVARLSIEKQ